MQTHSQRNLCTRSLLGGELEAGCTLTHAPVWYFVPHVSSEMGQLQLLWGLPAQQRGCGSARCRSTQPNTEDYKTRNQIHSRWELMNLLLSICLKYCSLVCPTHVLWKTSSDHLSLQVELERFTQRGWRMDIMNLSSGCQGISLK